MPGYVEKAFMSRDGKSFAFITADKFEETFNKMLQKTFQKRMILLNSLTSGVKSNLIIVKVLAKSQTFNVHKFIIDIRAPKLWNFVKKNSNFIDLRQFNNSVVQEFIQFLYLNISLTLKILQGDTTLR